MRAFVGRCSEAGEVLHEVEQQLLVKGLLQQQVPYFNGRVFLENKAEVGKVDEILGPINEMVRPLYPAPAAADTGRKRLLSAEASSATTPPSFGARCSSVLFRQAQRRSKGLLH